MPMLELDIIKLHVRLEPDFSEDDQLLETYSNAARRVIEGRTGRTLYETHDAIPAEGDEHALVIDDDITTAMLLLIGHWYETREAVVIGTITSEVPMAVGALVDHYTYYHFA